MTGEWVHDLLKGSQTGSVYFFTDEKEKYDATAFRDSILQGLNEAGNDLEAVSISV